MPETIIIRDEADRFKAAYKVGMLDVAKCPHVVKVDEYKSNRSVEQNALMWRWNKIIADHNGDSVNAVHELLKQELLEPTIVSWKGEPRKVWITRNMKVGEMADYLNKLHAFAHSFLGINLPIPEELHVVR